MTSTYQDALSAFPASRQGVYAKHTLVSLSHAMEDQALHMAHRPIIFAAFQEARFVKPELRRYRRLAAQAEAVVVFAQEATSHINVQRDGVMPVDLAPNDPLCREWHLVILADNFMSLLLCREQPGERHDVLDPETDRDRRFDGFWSFDPALVRHAAARLLHRVARAYPRVALPSLALPSITATAMPFVQPLVTHMVGNLEDAIAREHTKRKQLQDAYEQTVRTLSGAVEANDPETSEHVLRVMELSEAIGRRLEWSEAALRDLRFGAALHDIGKIGVPAALLKKPGPLDEAETSLMREHTIIGARIISNVPFLAEAAKAVRHHHERWDGQGYPDQLAGNDIPPIAQIVALADVFDALRSDRPYRSGWSLDRVLAYMREQRDRAFDAQLTDLLFKHLSTVPVGALALH